MEDVYDPKDNSPRKSRWLLFCLPLMMLTIFSIVLIPLGVFYLKPYLEAQRYHKLMSSARTQPKTPIKVVASPIVAPSPLFFEDTKFLGPYTGTILDKRTWLDFTDFNTTFTPVSVAGLSIMGLNSTWNDTVRPNPYLPLLETPWEYGAAPVRGVSLKGWLALDNLVNTWLGKSTERSWSKEYQSQRSLNELKTRLETHYSTFITQDDFAQIADAGLNHVKIPVGYWLVNPMVNDAHLAHVGWRYLLRGLEFARRYGLRVYIDLVSDTETPQSSSYTDDLVHPEAMLQVLGQLAEFLSQDRYRALVTMIGISQTPLDAKWISRAHDTVKKCGFKGKLVHNQEDEHTFPNMFNTVTTTMKESNLTYRQKIQSVCENWSNELTSIVKSQSPSIIEWDLRDASRGHLGRAIYRAFLKDFGKSQVAVYESSGNIGWIYNAWKTLGDPRMSYKAGIDVGILPNFNTTRTDFVCEDFTDYALMGLV